MSSSYAQVAWKFFVDARTCQLFLALRSPRERRQTPSAAGEAVYQLTNVRQPVVNDTAVPARLLREATLDEKGTK